MQLKDIIKCEEVLLRIKFRHENGDLTLPFGKLVLVEKEIKNIGEITDIYFRELERINNKSLNDDEKSKLNDAMMQSEVEYSLSNYNKVISSQEIIDFYGLKNEK